jgi:hypothetical protein
MRINRAKLSTALTLLGRIAFAGLVVSAAIMVFTGDEGGLPRGGLVIFGPLFLVAMVAGELTSPAEDEPEECP